MRLPGCTERTCIWLASTRRSSYQITNDVLPTSVADVNLKAETVLRCRSEDRTPSQPTDDADLNKLYRLMWTLEVLLDETAVSPDPDSGDDESESEGYDDLCAWERKRLAAMMICESKCTRPMASTDDARTSG